MNREDCEHLQFWYSRSLCACGDMHYFCLDCGEQLDPCEWEIGD